MGTVNLVKDTSQLQSLLDDVDSFIYDRAGPTASAGEFVDSTANGGEAIQAAVDALPDRGGLVFVPHVGPDNGIVNQNGISEDGVWAVNSPITTGSKSGVWIQGAAPGFRTEGNSGTKLIADSDIAKMVEFGSGYLDGMRMLYLDGGDQGSATTADYCVDFGGGNTVNDFQMHSCILTGATTANLLVSCDQNVWVNNSWIEIAFNATGGIEADLTRDLWITNSLFNRNGDSDIYTASSLNRLYSIGNRFRGSDNSIKCASNLSDSIISSCVFDEATNAALAVESGATVDTVKVSNCHIQGNGVTTNGINNQGTIINCDIQNFSAENLTGSKYVNVINDTTNTTRVTLDGLGYNGANDPSAGGDWNGNGREGVRVLWDNGGTPTLAEYVNGTWYSRAL